MPLAWLQAGEALERIWLEVTRAGYAMSLFTQVIEVPGTRQRLRLELGLTMHPHVLLRIGRAPATPASRRRKLVEVLRHAPGSRACDVAARGTTLRYRRAQAARQPDSRRSFDD